MIPLSKNLRKKKQMDVDRYWKDVNKLSFEIPNLEGTDAWKILMDTEIQDKILGAIHGNDTGNKKRRKKWREI